ncbi:hypothetical protein [Kitasatospora sp. NPDC058046]|uniref:hypothetical protein n=1 Tax=Kitasatospora sp. NPDC058046 TaxID=3346312 RepID=UPI0036D9D0CC
MKAIETATYPTQAGATVTVLRHTRLAGLLTLLWEADCSGCHDGVVLDARRGATGLDDEIPGRPADESPSVTTDRWAREHAATCTRTWALAPAKA